MSTAIAEQAYVSVVDWPKGCTPDRAIEAVVAATGIDPHAAAQRCAKPPPMVVARIPAAVAHDAVRVLHKAGVTAFAPSDSQLDSAADPVRAKRLQAAEGAPQPMYLCEPWSGGRGETTGFLARDIFLIVRARLVRRVRGPVKVETQYVYTQYGRVPVNVDRSRTDSSRLTDLFDLYLTDGRRIRVDGDKFNWDVLGKDRGHTDNLSADRLCLRLASEAPRAIIDTAFPTFHAPPGLIPALRERSRSNGGVVRDDSQVFDFYSVWAWLLYKRTLGR